MKKQSCAYCQNREGRYLIGKYIRDESSKKWLNKSFVLCHFYGEVEIKTYLSCPDYLLKSPKKKEHEIFIEPTTEEIEKDVQNYKNTCDKYWI
jgi:hypothetical protein